MKVYCVFDRQSSPYELWNIFLVKEEAEKYVEELNQEDPYYVVKEWETN